MKKVCCWLAMFIVALGAMAQGANKHEWFPKQSVFQPLLLDPLESQTYCRIVRMANADTTLGKDLYVPFAIGFNKPVWAVTKPSGLKMGVAVELVNHAQFEWLNNGQQRNYLNSDFKVGFSYQVAHNQWSMRARWYHLSSHTGDDVFIRRGISNFQHYVPSAANYELLDYVFSYHWGPMRTYAVLGAVARLDSPREKYMYGFGFMYRRPIVEDSPFHWLAGLDVKGWQFTGYTPNYHAAAGIGFGRNNTTDMALMLDLYAGNLPYGLNEASRPVYTNPVPAYPHQEWGGRVNWVGLAMYLNPVF